MSAVDELEKAITSDKRTDVAWLHALHAYRDHELSPADVERLAALKRRDAEGYRRASRIVTEVKDLDDVVLPIVGGEAYGQSYLAEHVQASNPGRFMYVPGLGWFMYDGRRWGQGNGEAEAQVRKACIRSARQILQEAPQAERALGDEMMKLARNALRKADYITGAMRFLADHDAVTAYVQELDADPYLLNVANGTLDLRTGELGPHDPAHRITKVTRGAFQPGTSSPAWQGFLDSSLGEDLAAAAQRCYGGIGLPGIVHEHVLPIVCGEGGSGKGTFYMTLVHAMGDYAITVDPSIFMAKRAGGSTTELVDLRGVRMAFGSETSNGGRIDAATVKRLTGGDRVRARRMRQDTVEFDASWLLSLITNHLPVAPADDTGLWRRLKVLPFDRPPAVPDRRLQERLRDDADAIVTWLVEGHAAYLAADLEVGWPERVETATSSYRETSDDFVVFMAECTAPSETGYVRLSELYDAWRQWVRDTGAGKPGRLQDLRQRLDRHGFDVLQLDQRANTWAVIGRDLIVGGSPWSA
jgi:putative DNA primase/helicase